MAAATASRNTMFRNVRTEGPMSVPLKANAKVYKGCMVAVDSTGYGIDAATATGLTVVGMALADGDNTGGSNGAISIDCLQCEAYLLSDGSDAPDQTNFGLSVYVKDNQTVSKTNGTSTRSAAGVMTGFDSNGVWVRLGVL